MRRQQRGQQHQPEAEAVDGDVIMNGRRIDPVEIGLECPAVPECEPERRDQAERNHEDDDAM